MNRRLPGYILYIWLIILVLALVGCGASQQPTVSAAAAQPSKTPGNLPPAKSGSAVMAEGKVVPVKDASLSFSTSGVVGQLLVSEGDQVQAGQPIIRLTGSERLQSSVSGAQLDLLTAQQALDTLNTNVDVSKASAQLKLAKAQKDLDDAKKRMWSKDYTRGDQEQIDTARANYIIAENGVKEAEKQYGRLQDRAQDDPIRAEGYSQVAAARQRRDTALANLNYLLQKPNELDLSQSSANLAVAQASVNEAQREMDLMKNGADANQLALAQSRMQSASDSLAAAQASLADLELKAPFSGTISAINVNPGEFVSPGVAVAQLADFTSWQVETTDLTELNISRVKVGQPAMVHFDALPNVGIIGRVTKIKPFGENRQGDVVYTVVLKLETPNDQLRWNMTASVTFLEKDAAQ